MSSGAILALMSFLFLFFGYLGVPVAFSLMAGVLIGAMFTDVSLTAIVQKIFDGMDSEAIGVSDGMRKLENPRKKLR